VSSVIAPSHALIGGAVQPRMLAPCRGGRWAAALRSGAHPFLASGITGPRPTGSPISDALVGSLFLCRAASISWRLGGPAQLLGCTALRGAFFNVVKSMVR
jgi:hypothetical protein